MLKSSLSVILNDNISYKAKRLQLIQPIRITINKIIFFIIFRADSILPSFNTLRMVSISFFEVLRILKNLFTKMNKNFQEIEDTKR